tara:strand:- start:6826 stop:7227 length:402 start_codon:yes stop_codon:yes gene_type:complete
MNIKYAAIAAIILLAGCQTTKDAPNLVALGVDFTWHGTQACSSVPPAFEIANIPEGTATLEFRMTDLDVPSFNHGGGSVKYTGSGSIPAGSFSYTGPCPPGGTHDYEFVVSAVNAAGDTVLGRGSATKSFPPK